MGKSDLRILVKQERTLRQSLENFKQFINNYQEDQDRSCHAIGKIGRSVRQIFGCAATD